MFDRDDNKDGLIQQMSSRPHSVFGMRDDLQTLELHPQKISDTNYAENIIANIGSNYLIVQPAHSSTVVRRRSVRQ